MKVSVDDKAISKHLRKSLVFNGKQTWMEETSIGDDTTMGAYHVAEVYERFGTFILNQVPVE